MQYKDLGPFLEVLETASGGQLAALAAECERRGLELEVYVLTHLEGLPEGEMKLCVHAIGEEGTATLQTIPLGPAQRMLGWNLYLQECMTRARASLANAKGCLKVVEALEGDEGSGGRGSVPKRESWRGVGTTLAGADG